MPKKKTIKKVPMPKTITFNADGWLSNTAIVGLYNIMPDQVILHDDSIEIPTDSLKDYPEALFNYFAEEYPTVNKPLNMLKYRNLVDEPMNDRDSFNKVFQTVNKTIVPYLSTNSTLNCLGLDGVTILTNAKKTKKWIQLNQDYQDFVKQVEKLIDPKPVKSKKTNEKRTAAANQYFDEHKKEIINTVVDYINNATDLIQDHLPILVQRYYGFRYIKKVWTAKFLNKNTASITHPLENVIEDFLQPALDYLTTKHLDEEPLQYCSHCGNPLYKSDLTTKPNNKKNTKLSYKWLYFGVDETRKTNHFWDHNIQSDMCPVCRLIYSAIPAGIVFANNQSIFVNDNHSVQTLIDTNNTIKQSIQSAVNSDNNQQNIWATIFRAFAEQQQKANLRSQNNIQIINAQYNGEKTHYRFLNISSIANEIIEIINSHSFDTKNHGTKTWLSGLSSAHIKQFQGQDYYSLYDLVVDHILKAQRLDNLIHTLITLKAANNQNAYFSITQIKYIMHINNAILTALHNRQANINQRRNDMSIPDPNSIDPRDLKTSWYVGYQISQHYHKENPKKASTVALQLNNDLRVNNLQAFMQKLMTICAVYTLQVPMCLAKSINNPDLFKQYADNLLTGLLTTPKSNETETDQSINSK